MDEPLTNIKTGCTWKIRSQKEMPKEKGN